MCIFRVLKLCFIVSFIAQFIGAVALAQSEEDQTLPSFCPGDIDDVAYNQTDDAEERVTIKACQWLKMDSKGRAFNIRANKQGNSRLFMGVASSQYQPDQERGNWAASRPLTYTDAYLDLATQFALQEYGQDLRSEVEKRGFSARGLDSRDLQCYPNETESKWYDRMVKKGSALLEGKLDEALREMDVDPGNFHGSPQRRLARRVEEFVFALEKSTERAVRPSKVSGLVVIKTFEEVNGPDAAIGILARWSDEVLTMTRLMADNSGNLPKDYPHGRPGKKVNQWIDGFKKDLNHTFGVRIMRDENGYPLLLAFGHSANRYFGPDRKKKKEDKQFSLDMSEEDAYSQLTEYVAATVQFAKTANKELEGFQGYELFDEQGKCIPDEVRKKSFKEKIEETWRSSARLDNFKGATRRYKGIVKHPMVEDVDIAVSVVAWSPEISTNSSTAKKVEKKSDQARGKVSGSLSSPAPGDPNDF